jgi:hypothetical protein
VISDRAKTAYVHGFLDSLKDPVPPPAPEHMGLLSDALQLVQELWPHPYNVPVILNTDQWVKLRKALLSIPDLLAEAER